MSGEGKELNDPMKARKLYVRWVVQGCLTLESAMHLGGEEDRSVDMPILRDMREGAPLLTGTTFAGALRNALADRIAGFREKDPPAASLLFGCQRTDENGSQSPLIVFDALGKLPENAGIEIRDGVVISAETGVAADGKKFDFEVLPAGTTFPVRLDLLVSEEPLEKELLALMAAALDEFSDGKNSFGARRSKGLGRVSAKWTAKRYELTSPEGWMAWLGSDHSPEFKPEESEDIYNAIKKAAPHLSEIKVIDDKRKQVIMALTLNLTHDILIRSPNKRAVGPDVSHLQSGGKPILSGSSLAGVLRAHALRIARLVRAEKNDAEEWIKRLFGPRFEGQKPPKDLPLHASRLRVGEAEIRETTFREQIRIAIDRFTGGTVDAALFEEEPAVGGVIRLNLEIRNPEKGETGLMLLVLKDLLDGALPVGGASSVGRGRVKGTAEISFYGEDPPSGKCAVVKPGKAPEGEAADEINNKIKEFHEAEPLPQSRPKGEVTDDPA